MKFNFFEFSFILNGPFRNVKPKCVCVCVCLSLSHTHTHTHQHLQNITTNLHCIISQNMILSQKPQTSWMEFYFHAIAVQLFSKNWRNIYQGLNTELVICCEYRKCLCLSICTHMVLDQALTSWQHGSNFIFQGSSYSLQKRWQVFEF